MLANHPEVVRNIYKLIFTVVFAHATAANNDVVCGFKSGISELVLRYLGMLISENHLNVLFCREVSESLRNCRAAYPSEVLFFIIVIPLSGEFVALH